VKESTVGILIEPSEVRLITGPDDPYAWTMLPGKEYLFKKHLSKHSLEAYMELCQEVGVSFEAVPAKVDGPIALYRMSLQLNSISMFIFQDREPVLLPKSKNCGQKTPG